MKTFWPSSVPSQAGAAPLEPAEMYMPNWDESLFSQLHSHSCVFKQRIRIFKQETDDTFHSSLFTPVGGSVHGILNFLAISNHTQP